jgi:hypothetical protein
MNAAPEIGANAVARQAVVYPRSRMSTTLVAALLAGFGLLAVLGVSYAFYLVGRAEDRDRAERAAPPEPERPPHRAAEPSDHEHRVARDRRRPLPPRRPQR